MRGEAIAIRMTNIAMVRISSMMVSPEEFFLLIALFPFP